MPFTPTTGGGTPVSTTVPVRVMLASNLVCYVMSWVTVPTIVLPPNRFVCGYVSLSKSSSSGGGGYTAVDPTMTSFASSPGGVVLSFGDFRCVSWSLSPLPIYSAAANAGTVYCAPWVSCLFCVWFAMTWGTAMELDCYYVFGWWI